MKTRMKFLLGAVAAAFASTCLAVPLIDENTNAQIQASPGAEELNLATLEDRLRETKAISGLKKLGLKSEIDNLLARFRIAHAGGRPEVVALRDPYEKLIAKIQGLLPRDPQLARDITASKGKIWAVLADRTQFAGL